jgi:hypothetical protein
MTSILSSIIKQINDMHLQVSHVRACVRVCVRVCKAPFIFRNLHVKMLFRIKCEDSVLFLSHECG